MIRYWLGAHCVIAMLLASNAHADAFYTLVGLQMNQIKISQSSFDSWAVAGRVGTWLDEGIGIELGANLPFTDEKSIALQLTWTTRYQQPYDWKGR